MVPGSLDLEVIAPCEAEGTGGSILASQSFQQHGNGHRSDSLVAAMGGQRMRFDSHEHKLMSQLADAGNVNNLRKVIQLSHTSYGPWHFRYERTIMQIILG